MARPPVARFAIVGPPQSGKTTLFCALTGQNYNKIVILPKAPALAVPVREPRLARLHEREQPQSNLVFPTIELADTPSLSYDSRDREKNVDAITQFREVDGLVGVVRGDRPEAVRAEIVKLRSELFLEDAAILERRIETIRSELKKPGKHDEAKRELEVCERLAADVSSGKTDAFKNLSADDEKKIKGFMLFSRKPMIVLGNPADAELANFKGEKDFLVVCVKLEAELAAMASEEERREFMQLYGLTSLALEGLPLDLYRRMGYIMYFTPGEKETAGWGIKLGTPALEAAGKIHTDIQKGFITAEVTGFADYEKLGSTREVRSKGRARNEGKTYVVQDGDIIEFKHS